MFALKNCRNFCSSSSAFLLCAGGDRGEPACVSAHVSRRSGIIDRCINCANAAGSWWTPSKGTSSHRQREVQLVLFPDQIQPPGRREQGSLCRWDQSGWRSKPWTQRGRTHPDTRSDRIHGGASDFLCRKHVSQGSM